MNDFSKIKLEDLGVVLLSQVLILFNPLFIDLFLSLILIIISIIDVKYLRIPNFLVLIVFFLGAFSKKAINHDFPSFNFYISILLLMFLFGLSLFTDMFGMGDFKLLTAIFVLKGSNYFIGIFFLLNTLLFIYSLIVFIRKRNSKTLIPLGPFVYFSHLLLILGGV